MPHRPTLIALVEPLEWRVSPRAERHCRERTSLGAHGESEDVAAHERFRFRSQDELLAKIVELGLELPCAQDISVLREPTSFGRLELPNRLAVQPMEGCDGTPAGEPSELTLRRYRRWGAGGAGLIWFEACAIVPEARANPRQLWLHEGSAGAFKRIINETRAAAAESMHHRPVLVLQLTHSGRYSRPVNKPEPIIAHRSAVLDPHSRLPPDYPLISDQELNQLQERYVEAAQLASQVGFDAVDIKSCHRYLINELLASFTRADSRYGGPYENRARMLLETASRIRQAVPEIDLTCRLNLFDGVPYPYGWGVDRERPAQPDLTEPLRLIGQLMELGLRAINVSAGNPYYNAHYGRPFDWPDASGSIPQEHPVEGVARLVHLARQAQQAYPELAVVGTGYSWLRQYFAHFAAAAVEKGWVRIVGLGRGALAYPDFAKDLITQGRMEPLRVCISCSSCTQIMRDGGQVGCVARDYEYYAPALRAGRMTDPAEVRKLAANCRQCIDPTCAAKCPAGIDVPAFLTAVAEGEEREAYRILRQANVLPEICGIVCPVEVQCEGHCLEGHLTGQAVPIAAIQRYVARRAREEGWTELDVPAEQTGKKVAIVGAGPAGLACAAGLLERGHAVCIIERSKRPGGMADCAIPSDRLPVGAAEAEVGAILGDVAPERMECRLSTPLGAGYDIDAIESEGFDALVLAFGLSAVAGLSQGADRPLGVFDAISFLTHAKRDPCYGLAGTVAVIGGGNTAMDAAVVAKQRGAEAVYLLYRRSFQEMPAWPSERERCLQAGVHVLVLTQTLGYQTDEGGRLIGLRVARTRPGEMDATGRRRPIVLAETEHTLIVDMVIEAIGQKMPESLVDALAGVALTNEGLIQVGPATHMTSRAGVFAAGDVVTGPGTVVQAIAQGRRAAEQIDAYLRKNDQRRSE